MSRLSVLSIALFLSSYVGAQTTINGVPNQQTPIVAATSAVTGKIPSINPMYFGAVGDGNSHTAGSVLGISTLAGLASYTSNGLTPYSWVNAAPYGYLYSNLPASQPASSSATTVYIGVTKTTGIVLPTTSSSSSGQNSINIDAYNAPGGTPVSGSSCIPANTVIGQQFGTVYTLVVAGSSTASNLTCTIATGTAINLGIASYATPVIGAPLSGQSTSTIVGGTQFGINTGYAVPGSIAANSAITGGAPGTQPASLCVNAANFTTGILTLCSPATFAYFAFNNYFLLLGWSVFLTDTAGVEPGQIVTGTGASGTVYVENVNRSINLIDLSAPVGAIAAGVSLSFTWPDAAKIVPGTTTVTGPQIAGGTKVQAYNSTTGAVTLTTPTIGALTTSTSANYANGVAVTTPALRGSPMVFWTPWTDSQATSLQMDAIGIVAAEKYAETLGGGLVQVPAGTWLMDQPVEVPVFGLFASHTPVVHIAGSGTYSTSLKAFSDMGKDRYLLSCGDSTATPESGTGIYGSSGAGAWCDGQFRDLSLTSPASVGVNGTRPKIGTLPIEMGGVWGGPRRIINNLDISFLNTGIEYHADHTMFNNDTIDSNYKGIRMGWAMSQLYGDDTLNHVMMTGNGLCGLCISADTYWNGQILADSYFGFNPYAILFEAGAYTSGGVAAYAQGLQGTTSTNSNLESSGCGMITDGNIWADGLGSHANRSIANVTLTNTFSSYAAGSVLPAGCVWTAYINTGTVTGLTIDQIWPNAFPGISGSLGILSTNRIDNFSSDSGGAKFSGPGLVNIFTNYGSSCIPFMGEPGTTNSTFYNTQAYTAANFEIPGVINGRFGWWQDSTTTTPVLGTVAESIASSVLVMQAAGRATTNTSPVVGTVMQQYNSGNCTANAKVVPIATEGDRIPIAVSAAQSLGALLTSPASSASAGIALATAAASNASWQVELTNGGSTSLVYGRSLARGNTATSGIATLTSGTVTVTNAAACTPSATCVYKLTNCVLNGSTVVGVPSIGTVSAGTSFVINSLTALAAVSADTSNICWQIN